MEEEIKMSFWEKLKTSIIGLENYQKLAIQKIGKTILYIVIIMLIFSFIISIATTYVFHKEVKNVSKYIEENIETLTLENGNIKIEGKENPIIIEKENSYYDKIVIDTQDLSQEKIDEYKNEIAGYSDGIIILKDRIFLKTYLSASIQEFTLQNLATTVGMVKIEKQDVLNFLSSNEMFKLYAVVMIAFWVIMFINLLAATLIDAILYSILAYFTGMFTGLRLKYVAAYNIATYSLTLPIFLNLIYTVLNILTGFTIKYFSIMYVAITCIYICAAILIIKSDIIKKQMELSKIIEEQERVKQEIERKKQEEKEEEEREKVRKKDEKKRQEEKEKSKKEPKEDGPEPQANIKMNS